MSFKDDIIVNLTLKRYHDLNNIQHFSENVKVADVYDKIIRILNKANLKQTDVMNLLKNLTLNTIGQCNEDYINSQEKMNMKKFQRDLK